MKLQLLVALALGVATAPGLAEQKLDPAERSMLRTIESEHERSIGWLEKLVNQNSGTMNPAGVEAVGRMVRGELESLGFTVRWQPMQEVGRAGHLLATHEGSGRGQRMLLIGHLDTVFEPDSPFQRFERNGEFAKGPGVSDNKGGVVVMVSALRAMHAAGTLAVADIEIVLTGDEEDLGTPLEIARRDLIEAGKRADVALDFEGLSRQDGRDMGAVARRSAATWKVTATGKGGHSSTIFSEHAGNGAVYELARILDDFRRELPEKSLTFNVGLVVAGAQATLADGGTRGSASGKTNIIPSTAIARGDLRALSREQDARAREKMRAIVARHLPGTRAEIAFDPDNYPPMAPTSGNRALLALLNEINRDLGLPQMSEIDPVKRGAGDIGFVAEYVDGLVGLGTASTGDHSTEETVDLTSIERQAKRAAILMSRLAQRARDQ